MYSFDDIRKNPGQACKEHAEICYKRGKILAYIVAVLGGLSGIGGAIAVGESFLATVIVLLVTAAVTIVWIYVATEAAFRAALHLYARGEELHLLRDIKRNTSEKDENGECIPEINSKERATATMAQWAKTSEAVAKTTAKPAADEWKCACGRVNKNYTRTCVCGANARDRIK